MKMPARIVAWMLPLVLTGCFHSNPHAQFQPLAPPIEDAPPPSPVPSPTDLPPPVISEPNQNTEPASKTEVQTQDQPRPPVHHKKPAPPLAAQQAAIPNPGVSAIGQLTSGDQSDLRRETEGSIAATERGLNSLNRRLNDQEQKTASHIREFLKQARTALATGDVDGAHTLAAKAKVLLGELGR